MSFLYKAKPYRLSHFLQEFIFKMVTYGTIHLLHPVDGGSEGQLKKDKNSDGSGWLQGEGIHRNWMSTAIVSISVTRVQT